MNASTAEVIAQNLEANGIQRLFVYPGDPIIELMEQARRRGADIVLARREGTAAFMAEADAMLTGGIGVCVSTLGPGSTAMVNGVAAATLDRVPMLAISGQIETAREAYFTHQVVDHAALYRPVTKWAGRLEASAAGVTMRKAIRTATAERPGAVHVSCCSDVLKAEAHDATVIKTPMRSSNGSVQIYRSFDADDPISILSQARRPMLLLGIGSVRCEATAAALALAAEISMPIVVTPMAKGVVPEDVEWFAGVLDMACSEVVWNLLRSSDLILAAGFDPVELIKPWSLNIPVLHIDTTANTDQVYFSAIEAIGDIAHILQWLADSFQGEPRWSAAELKAHRLKLADGYYSGRVAGALNPTDVVDAIRAATPLDTIATCDVGSHKLLVGQGWKTYHARSVLMTNGLSAMGFGVPAGIAAKLARPNRPVVAMVGDGGFAMTATELRLAASRGLGIAFVVFVDGSLNRIELKQSALNYPSTATRIEDTDLVLLAESMGCDADRVDSRAALDRALMSIGTLKRPLVIEARIDPGQYESQF